MAARKVLEETDGRFMVRVYRDSEWQEWQARLYENGKEYVPARAYCDSKQEAVDTARHMLNAEVGRR
jgi:hypothetical protein